MYLLKRKVAGQQSELVGQVEGLKELPSVLESLGFAGAKKKVVNGIICYYKGKEVLYVDYQTKN